MLFAIQLCIGIFALVIVKNADDLEAGLQDKFKELIMNYNNPAKPSNPILDPLHQEVNILLARKHV